MPMVCMNATQKYRNLWDLGMTVTIYLLGVKLPTSAYTHPQIILFA